MIFFGTSVFKIGISKVFQSISFFWNLNVSHLFIFSLTFSIFLSFHNLSLIVTWTQFFLINKSIPFHSHFSSSALNIFFLFKYSISKYSNATQGFLMSLILSNIL